VIGCVSGVESQGCDNAGEGGSSASASRRTLPYNCIEGASACISRDFVCARRSNLPGC
jgi:hypothetical protein